MDAGNSAFATCILVAVFPLYLNTLLQNVNLNLDLGFGIWRTSALSVWGYSVSLSVLISILLCLGLGTWADRQHQKKVLCLFFQSLGAIGCMALSLTTHWASLLVIFVLTNVGFVAGNVFYNSLLSSVAPPKDWDHVSLQGFAWGYISGGSLLSLCLLLIFFPQSVGFEAVSSATRAGFFLVGLWWLICLFPAFKWIQESRETRSASLASWQSLRRTLSSLVADRRVLWFIVAYALFNDGIQTVITMSSVYAKDTLGLEQNSIILTFLVIQFVGWPATLAASSFSRRTGAKRALEISLLIWMGLLIFAFFMTSERDFLLLGLGVALVLGISQALPRSLFAAMIPKGQQSQYFSVYALSGKVASVIGPAFFSLVLDLTQSARFAILSLLSFFVLGFLILHRLDLSSPRDVARH